MADVTLRFLDIPDISDDEWHKLTALRVAEQQETHPGDPVQSAKTHRVELSSRHDWPNVVDFYMVFDAHSACVGMLLTTYPKRDHPDYETNKHILWVTLYVERTHRQRGIGKALLPFIAEKARSYGASVIQWSSQLPSGQAFSQKIGAQTAMTVRVSRMTLADLDWPMMSRWVNDGKSRNPDVQIVRFNRLPPEDDLDGYCQLLTDLARTVPLEDLEAEGFTTTPDELRRNNQRNIERGNTYVVLYAKDADGSLMGMTGMFHVADIPTVSFVGLTGVLPAYRGRGLGKYLKALMAFDLRDNYPSVTVAQTDNAESNAPMLSINERMGFKPYQTTIDYKITVEKLFEKQNHGISPHTPQGNSVP